MRGRKPKPVERQIAEGDPSKHGTGKLQQRLEAQVKASRGLPKCPRHLRGRARAAWNLWKEELELMNLDCRSDAMMLEGACVSYERAVEADAMISKEGITITIPIFNKQGEEVGRRAQNHPAIAISNRAWLLAKAFCSEFGLSPVSRTRLTIERGDTGEQDLWEILRGPRVPKVGNPQ